MCINFLNYLKEMQNSLDERDWAKINIRLINPALEYEFYNSLIAKNVEWFDILKQNNVFDYHSFLVKASQDGDRKSVV